MLFTVVGNTCSRNEIFYVQNMSSKAIRKNKILTIFGNLQYNNVPVNSLIETYELKLSYCAKT